MMAAPRRWADHPRSHRYRDLDHPADLWLEVHGDTLPDLAENALFALFDTLVETEGVEAEKMVEITVRGAGPAEALRTLLAEALFLFDSERFAAAGAMVRAEVRDALGETVLSAELWGRQLSASDPAQKTEVKAVTHHRLHVASEPGRGWTASVLLDV